MFLFSATFFPISVYPEPLRVFIELTPLYHSVDLIRGLTTSTAGASSLWDVVYLILMGIAGVVIAALRLRRKLLR
jgi:lipooligosaccharide transport system permease protein